jgi:hypothetical protein
MFLPIADDSQTGYAIRLTWSSPPVVNALRLGSLRLDRRFPDRRLGPLVVRARAFLRVLGETSGCLISCKVWVPVRRRSAVAASRFQVVVRLFMGASMVAVIVCVIFAAILKLAGGGPG